MTIPDDVILALIAQVNEIETELGLNPGGVYSDVRVRLDILESRINNPLSPSPNVPNPFTIGNDGITISTGTGAPTENRLSGSLYLRTDGYADEGVYSFRPDGYWHKVSSSSGSGGGVQALSNIAALAALPVTSANDGELAYILSVQDLWVYHATGPAMVDGITAIVANGPGVWERYNLGSINWRSQATWFVDPISGNDENNGLTSGTAVKTLAEISRRWGPKPVITQSTTINLLGDIPGSDSFYLSEVISSDTIFYVGKTTTLTSGTLTTYTAYNAGTSLPQITDTSQSSFSSYIGKRIRFTSGTATGAVAWIQRDDGSHNATISVPTLITGVSEPTTGDSYVIENLSNLFIDKIDVVALGNSIPNTTFRDITAVNFGENITFYEQAVFFGSNLGSVPFAGGANSSFLNISGCILPEFVTFTSLNAFQSITTSGCVFLFSSGFIANSSAIASQLLFIRESSSVIADDLAVFDYSGTAITVADNSTLTLGAFNLGTGIWGSNVRFACQTIGGGTIISGNISNPFPVPSDFIHVVTTGADVIVENVTKSYAELPYLDKGTGSGIYSWGVANIGTIYDILATAQITSDQNNYNGGDPFAWARAEIVNLSSDASRNITGFTAMTSDVNRKTLVNTGGFNIVLKYLDSGSSAANRIRTSTGSDFTLVPGAAVDILYNESLTNWIVL